jgi:hypothetical protein
MRRYDPGAMAHAHGHHSARGIDKLVPIMKMGWDYVSCGVVTSEGRDLGMSVSRGIENRTLAVLPFRAMAKDHPAASAVGSG